MGAQVRQGVPDRRSVGPVVAVHVYVPKGIQRAICAGVRCIEHGQLTDEETVKLMAKEKDAGRLPCATQRGDR